MFGANGKSINVNDLERVLDEVDLIDIRESYEVKYGTLKGAKNIPMGELLENPEDYLKKGKKYYIMCQSGMRSARAVGMLSDQGFNVINVSGGFGSYVGNKLQK